jgi:hypothetical protein
VLKTHTEEMKKKINEKGSLSAPFCFMKVRGQSCFICVYKYVWMYGWNVSMRKRWTCVYTSRDRCTYEELFSFVGISKKK